ncbi:hypothetical protein KUCAC02_009103, partial [Chaenocephalus aceratus]
FIVPNSCVICNDIMAYMFGFFFRRTPLIKKPSVDLPVPKIPSDPRTSTDSGTPTKAVVEKGRPITNGRQPDKERSAVVTVVSREGDLVLGSDGKMYRLQRGPPGRMGPPGQEGCTGDPGRPGFNGDKGKLGSEGRSGKRGESGPPGPPGFPTFYLWKNTAEELAAFQGPLGLEGQMGTSRTQRTPRACGPMGARGDPGFEGPLVSCT